LIITAGKTDKKRRLTTPTLVYQTLATLRKWRFSYVLVAKVRRLPADGL
jgi:hypothetical protein